MNETHRLSAADDIVAAYLETVAEPNHASLLAWVRRYPQYERELTEATVNWGEMRHLPATPGAGRVDEDALVRRSMSIVRSLLQQRQPRAANQPAADAAPITGILDEAQRHGLRSPDVAAAAGMNRALLHLLDRRLIAAARIPQEAIEAVAAAVRCAPTAIGRYLAGPPLPRKAAQHRADQAPELAEPIDFFDAVRAERTLTEAQRAYWLALEPMGDGGETRPGGTA